MNETTADLNALAARMSEWQRDARSPIQREDARLVIAALAAERERADALALLIEQAPHEDDCDSWFNKGDLGRQGRKERPCDCWKSSNHSAALVAAHYAEVKAQVLDDAAANLSHDSEVLRQNGDTHASWGQVADIAAHLKDRAAAIREEAK
jgi:hypothetical protein